MVGGRNIARTIRTSSSVVLEESVVSLDLFAGHTFTQITKVVTITSSLHHYITTIFLLVGNGLTPDIRSLDPLSRILR
jgi:hypothetical protein